MRAVSCSFFGYFLAIGTLAVMAGCTTAPNTAPSTAATDNAPSALDNIQIAPPVYAANNDLNNHFNAARNSRETSDNPPPSLIALYIPLSGLYQSAGDDILAGVLAAYYQSASTHRLRVIDSQAVAAAARLSEIVADTSDVTVIGPLLADTSLTVSTAHHHIMLHADHLTDDGNHTTPAASPQNRLAFDLRPVADVPAMLGQCLVKACERIVIMAEDNARGILFAERAANAWYGAGREVLDTVFLPARSAQTNTHNARDTAAMLRHILVREELVTVYENQSALRQTRLTFPFIRQDIDAIIASLPLETLQQLQSVMDSIGGGSIPILASSQLGRSLQSETVTDGIEGVQYLDYTTPDMRGAFFSALGYDSFSVAQHIARNDATPLQGRLGMYTFDGVFNSGFNKGLTRHLDWYQIRNGEAVRQHAAFDAYQYFQRHQATHAQDQIHP